MKINFSNYKQSPQKLFEKFKPKLIPWLKLQVKNSLIHSKQKAGLIKLTELEDLTHEDFIKYLPPTSKTEIFSDQAYLKTILSKHPWIRIIPAAGTSRDLLSFRVANRERELLQFKKLASTVCKMWNIDINQSLIINGYPTGVTVPDGFNSIECSSKPEVIALSLASFRDSYPSLLFIGQPHFLKYCVLNGYITKDDFKKMHFLVGGTLFTHSLISLLAQKLETTAEEFERKIMSLYGIAEIGLGIGMETPDLGSLRANSTSTLENGPSAPHLFAIDTDRFLVETVQDEVHVTVLDPNADLPLLRYNTGDCGFIVDLPNSILPQHFSNHTIMALYSRKPKQADQYPLLEQEVEDRLNQFPDLFQWITGNFSISPTCLTFESHPHGCDPDTLMKRLKDIMKVNCSIKITDHIRYEGHISDLMRKPRVYVK